MVLFPGCLQTFLLFFVHTLLSLLWPCRGDAGPGQHAGPGGGGGGIGSGGQCPKVCFCNQLSKIVYCSRRGLPFIPDTIPDDTLQLNLNGNVFTNTALQRSNFSHLANLEHLYMSECGIESIEVDTFRDLTKLQWLDLSNNNIKVVPDFTFRGLTLQHLFLNGNRHITLQPRALDGLTTSGLYLHDCSLNTLHPDVLTPLNNTLRYLWLNGNELDRMERRFSPLFTSLSHLRLGSNPLHCNCELLWLKEFYDRNGDKFKGAAPPSCLTPQKLRGKFFNEMAMTDFRCQAPIFNNIDALFDHTVGRLKCVATGDPAPTLYWIQPNGRTTKYTPPASEEARKNEGSLVLTKNTESDPDLAGMYICVANNEAGNVTLTINVSWPHPRINVPYKTISTHPSTVTSQGSRTEAPVPSSRATSTQTPPGGRRRTTTMHAPVVPRQNYTALNMEGGNSVVGENSGLSDRDTGDPTSTSTDKTFNLSQLIGAIIGTHLCTLLLCLIVIPLYYHRKWKHARHSSLEKAKLPPTPQPPPESVYLNGLGHHPSLGYMDIVKPCKR